MKHLQNLFLRRLLVFLLASMMFGCKTKHVVQKSSISNDPKTSGTTIPFHPLRDTADLDILIKEVRDARVVLLGESTHGTSEFYKWRTEISKRLIQEKGFDFIAVEGDWEDGYLINKFIQGPAKDTALTIDLLKQFKRWPTWLWANYETAALVNWLNQYNQQKSEEDKIGFNGLDLFAFWQPIERRIPFIKDTAILNAAKKLRDVLNLTEMML
jgi:erythromycin esterase